MNGIPLYNEGYMNAEKSAPEKKPAKKEEPKKEAPKPAEKKKEAPKHAKAVVQCQERRPHEC